MPLIFSRSDASRIPSIMMKYLADSVLRKRLANIILDYRYNHHAIANQLDCYWYCLSLKHSETRRTRTSIVLACDGSDDNVVAAGSETLHWK